MDFLLEFSFLGINGVFLLIFIIIFLLIIILIIFFYIKGKKKNQKKEPLLQDLKQEISLDKPPINSLNNTNNNFSNNSSTDKTNSLNNTNNQLDSFNSSVDLKNSKIENNPFLKNTPQSFSSFSSKNQSQTLQNSNNYYESTTLDSQNKVVSTAEIKNPFSSIDFDEKAKTENLNNASDFNQENNIKHDLTQQRDETSNFQNNQNKKEGFNNNIGTFSRGTTDFVLDHNKIVKDLENLSKKTAKLIIEHKSVLHSFKMDINSLCMKKLGYLDIYLYFKQLNISDLTSKKLIKFDFLISNIYRFSQKEEFFNYDKEELEQAILNEEWFNYNYIDKETAKENFRELLFLIAGIRLYGFSKKKFQDLFYFQLERGLKLKQNVNLDDGVFSEYFNNIKLIKDFDSIFSSYYEDLLNVENNLKQAKFPLEKGVEINDLINKFKLDFL